MKYNIDADHLKALFEEMSNDAGRSISKGNTAIDDSDQLGLQLGSENGPILPPSGALTY